MCWQWERVQAAGNSAWMLVQGVRADLILLGLLVAIPVLLAPVLALARFHKIWRGFSYIWCLIALTLLIFIGLKPAFVWAIINTARRTINIDKLIVKFW